MKKIFLLTLIKVLSCLILRGQGLDTHVSQFWINTSKLNPALTGITGIDLKSDRNIRAMFLARSQDHATQGWSSDYQNISASLDGNIGIKFKKYYSKEPRDYIGMGLTVMNAKAGDLDVNTLQIHANSSLIKQLSHDNYLSIGLGIGYVQNGFDLTRARWGSQGNNDGTFDPNKIPFDLAMLNQNKPKKWFDMSAGVTLYKSIKTNNYREGFGVGFAAHHLTRPNISFLNNPDERMPVRYVFHGAYEKRRNKSVGWNIRAMVALQNQSLETLLGGNITYDIDDIVIQTGAYLRLNNGQNQVVGDALIPVVRIDWLNFSIGFSYDFNVFQRILSEEISRGLEFTLMYRGTIQKVRCPDWSRYNFTF
jgi:type IX secretion system PorP/SprF family membrane protein